MRTRLNEQDHRHRPGHDELLRRHRRERRTRSSSPTPRARARRRRSSASPSGERLVGQVAKRQAVTNPQNTVYARQAPDGPQVRLAEATRKQVELVPVRDRRAPTTATPGSSVARHRSTRRRRSPRWCSSTMKEIAESYLGEPITEAVITVPAYFDDAQRQATKDAGTHRRPRRQAHHQRADRGRARLRPRRKNEGSERIAVYDLGGGTFDISILEISDGVFSVQATGGDTYLGGEDFDDADRSTISRDKFENETRHRSAQGSHGAAAPEGAGREGASTSCRRRSRPRSTCRSSPPTPTGPKHLVRDDQAQRARAARRATWSSARSSRAEQALEDAEPQGRRTSTGGPRRRHDAHAAVQTAVEEFFGKEPHKGVNPDEVVAVGAALQGAALVGRGRRGAAARRDAALARRRDRRRRVHTLIPRNTTIPTQKSEIFTTSVDNQPFVPIHVLQGEREMAADNKTLAQVRAAPASRRRRAACRRSR